MTDLEAERLDLSYRTGTKLTPADLIRKLEAERVAQPKKENK